jgi:hypothetical protein
MRAARIGAITPSRKLHLDATGGDGRTGAAAGLSPAPPRIGGKLLAIMHFRLPHRFYLRFL